MDRRNFLIRYMVVGQRNGRGDQVFGNNVGVEELLPVFDEAMKNGLNLWDSAVVYGMGDSETILSSFTKGCKREDVLISTKFTPQIADEMAAEETGVDTRGSWEMPMI